LWRAVDQSGEVLDILVQKRRDAKAAKRFFRKLLKGLRCVPRALVTDKLASYTSAKKDVIPDVAHHREQPVGITISVGQVTRRSGSASA
jgi:putative transposase